MAGVASLLRTVSPTPEYVDWLLEYYPLFYNADNSYFQHHGQQMKSYASYTQICVQFYDLQSCCSSSGTSDTVCVYDVSNTSNLDQDTGFQELPDPLIVVFR